MASPSTHQERDGRQPTNYNKRPYMGDDTEKLPQTKKRFNNPPTSERPSDSTHLDGGVNESPPTDHDDIQGRQQVENREIALYKKHSYWAKNYAGHFWTDSCGWRVLKPGTPPEPWWIEHPPPRSPSDPEYLCDVCRHINFCWIFENNKLKKRLHGDNQIGMGAAGRVLKQVNCSFCVLLASTNWTHDMTVKIQSRSFRSTYNDYNHPQTEVKYLSVGPVTSRIDLQVLDDSRPMRGRQISPYIKQQQQNIAKQWLEKCEHEHCSGEDAVLVPNLALIDLNQRCIVRPHGPVRYAALSYVWGKSPQKMYCTETQQEFETKGTLHSKQGFLPQTIADAMDLAAHIGLDYLWVDSLCILQDDEADKIYFIGRMGSIYGASAITIVDANGDHAGCGLVGMSSPRADCQRISTVQGMQLCTTIGTLSEPLLQFCGCAWLKRGWTYQEMLLSKRLLLVTHAQLQFVCDHTAYFEETHPHNPRTSDWTLPTHPTVPIRRSEASQAQNLHLYNIAVDSFTERHLTHEMDIIPAFDAIFKALYKDTGAESLFNLPDVEIEEALLWMNSINWLPEAKRRIPDQLPTWSWAGWMGHAWYFRITDPPPISAVLWRCTLTSAVDNRSELTLQEYRCANWREKGWSYKFLPDLNFYAYTHDSRPNVFFRNPIALEPHTGLHKPSFLDDSNTLHLSAFTVHISASTITPGLHLDNREELRDKKERHIFESSQYLAGKIVLDCLFANEASLSLVALARCSSINIQQCEQQLGMDLRNKAPLDWDPEWFKNISQPNDTDKPEAVYTDWQYWDQRRFQDKFYPLYSVLLVEMREGIAYRIGVGKVHIDAFHAADPIWEEVRLG